MAAGSRTRCTTRQPGNSRGRSCSPSRRRHNSHTLAETRNHRPDLLGRSVDDKWLYTWKQLVPLTAWKPCRRMAAHPCSCSNGKAASKTPGIQLQRCGTDGCLIPFAGDSHRLKRSKIVQRERVRRQTKRLRRITHRFLQHAVVTM